MTNRSRYALSYSDADGAPLSTVRATTKGHALSALLGAPGVRRQDADDALEGLSIGARDSVRVSMADGTLLVVTLDSDAPSEEDARILADAADYRRANGTASSADWRALDRTAALADVAALADAEEAEDLDLTLDAARALADRIRRDYADTDAATEAAAEEDWQASRYSVRVVDNGGPGLSLVVESDTDASGPVAIGIGRYYLGDSEAESVVRTAWSALSGTAEGQRGRYTVTVRRLPSPWAVAPQAARTPRPGTLADRVDRAALLAAPGHSGRFLESTTRYALERAAADPSRGGMTGEGIGAATEADALEWLADREDISATDGAALLAATALGPVTVTRPGGHTLTATRS